MQPYAFFATHVQVSGLGTITASMGFRDWTARFEQERVNDVVNLMNAGKYGGNLLPVSRYIYELKGKVKLGPVRAPHTPLTEAQKAGIRADLDAMKFFDWCD